MNLSEQLLSALALYGIPMLCLVTLVSCAGAPLPVSLLLIAAGSFADHGEMDLGAILACGILCSVAGDNIGFAAGRWGGRRFARRMAQWVSGEQQLEQAEAKAREWGGVGIFLTRWLFTPLGPFVNLVSGFAGYSWSRFLLWDLAGESVWVVGYVMVGKLFSRQVQEVNAMLGNASWAIFALMIALFLAWRLYSFLRKQTPEVQQSTARS